ncbi:MAG: LacI family DNA-binding transcriptional regulator, partial [Lentisphaerota bacterium]
MKRKPVSFRDVAKLAAVSVGTVSRVFNGYNVDPEIAAKVNKTFRELGYIPTQRRAVAPTTVPAYPSFPAISLFLGENLADSSSWTQRIAYSIALAFSRYGYKVSIEKVRQDETQVPDSMKTSNGCVIWGDFSESFYDNLKKLGNKPVVAYTRIVPYENSISVLVDNRQSMSDAVEYLLACNYRD